LIFNLKKSKYPSNLINDAIKWAFENHNTNTHSTNKTGENSTFPLVLNFCTNLTPFKRLLNNSINVLSSVPETKIIFNDKIPTFSYKVNNSIFNILNKPKPAIYKCNSTNCECCHQIITGNSFNINTQIISPNTVINCKSRNVIYILICNVCNELYVGQTNCNLHIRMNGHRSQSKATNPILFCDLHFKLCSNGFFLIIPIYKLPDNYHTSSLLLAENYFVNLLNPTLNR
jgi:hypothetical protein